MLATIRDDTWKVLNIQHITPNLKWWDYSDTPAGGHKNIKEPPYMVEEATTLKKPEPPPILIEPHPYWPRTYSM